MVRSGSRHSVTIILLIRLRTRNGLAILLIQRPASCPGCWIRQPPAGAAGSQPPPKPRDPAMLSTIRAADILRRMTPDHPLADNQWPGCEHTAGLTGVDA